MSKTFNYRDLVTFVEGSPVTRVESVSVYRVVGRHARDRLSLKLVRWNRSNGRFNKTPIFERPVDLRLATEGDLERVEMPSRFRGATGGAML